jgi:hypothetical protein
MSGAEWLAARKALLRKRLARTRGRISAVRSTLFIKHLDTLPEVLLDSALADAEARGIDRVCVFFSHLAAPDLLASALANPQVAAVGTKDSYPERPILGTGSLALARRSRSHLFRRPLAAPHGRDAP